MRIVAVADTHMFHAEFATPGAMPDGDVFLHAGDMGRAGDEEELTEVARWIRSLPHAHKVVVPGNHDFLFQLEEQRARDMFAGIHVLIDEEIVIDEVRMYGSPWTPVFFDWAFMRPRGALMAEKWALVPAGLDVLVTHGPPHGVLDNAGGYRATGARHVGCEALRERVRVVRPRVHVFGHIHNQRGSLEEDGTRFVNCTTNESELAPTVIDVSRE